MQKIFWRAVTVFTFVFTMSLIANAADENKNQSQTEVNIASNGGTGSLSAGESISTSSTGLISRVSNAGPVVLLVLIILISMSILVWAIVFAKWLYFNRLDKSIKVFVDSFWESRSLNDLNNKINEFEHSPVRELFKKGYAELGRGNQLKGQYGSSEFLVQASMDNLQRALNKAKISEKQDLEKYLPIMAIAASACPFIGLFGTVWGIMRAFEGIAQTGNASLAAVAPGISEALIATAFGLAAAIPAAIGYNVFSVRIRHQLQNIDAFIADFLNIVERYLVSENMKTVMPLKDVQKEAHKDLQK